MAISRPLGKLSSNSKLLESAHGLSDVGWSRDEAHLGLGELLGNVPHVVPPRIGMEQ